MQWYLKTFICFCFQTDIFFTPHRPGFVHWSWSSPFQESGKSHVWLTGGLKGPAGPRLPPADLSAVSCYSHVVMVPHNPSAAPPPGKNAGLLCQPDPEAPYDAVWTQLSAGSVLRRGSFRDDGRASKGEEGEGGGGGEQRGSRQHRCHVHSVWPVRLCSNAAHKNHRPSRGGRGICQPLVNK